jgi:hypothetical protein
MLSDRRISRSGARRQETAEPTREPEPPPSAAVAILALQRGAGNQAVMRMLRTPQRPALMREPTQEATQKRAYDIWEEKGGGHQDDTGRQADWGEAKAQLDAQERVTRGRAQGIYEGKNLGGAEQTPEQAAADWIAAEKAVAADFEIEKVDEYNALTGKAEIWSPAGLDPAAQTALTAIKDLLKTYGTDKGELLEADKTTRLNAIQTAIDSWLSTHGGASAVARAAGDSLMMVKRFTLSRERQKLIVVRRVAKKYAVTVDTMAGIRKAGALYAPTADVDTQIVPVMIAKDFTLAELLEMEKVLNHYQGLLGEKRPAAVGPQPLGSIGRTQEALDPGPSVAPNVFAETYKGGATNVTMFDFAHTATAFPTGMQEYRATFTHELSHALIEDLVKQGAAEPIVAKFANEMDFWGGNRLLSAYWRPPGSAGNNCDEAMTRLASKRADVEAPKTHYAMTNAMEDLAESTMFFFEDPSALLTQCPERFAFIKDNLGEFFDAEHMQSLPQPAPPVVVDPLAEFDLGIF